MFTLTSDTVDQRKKGLSNIFIAQMKQIDKPLLKFITSLHQKNQIVLYLMEWILSLFTRLFYPENTSNLIQIWIDLVREPTPQRALFHCCRILSTFKENVFEKCGVQDEESYQKVFGAEGVEFLQAVSHLRIGNDGI